MADGKIKVYFCEFENLNPLPVGSLFANLKRSVMIDLEEIDKLEGADIIVAFVKMQDLHDENKYLNLINEEKRFRLISNFNKKEDFKNRLCKNNDKKCYNSLPIILIGLEDIAKEEDNIIKYLNLDQRVKFFDSSIWHRYVALDKSFENKFKKVLDEIINNQNLRLYETSVSREFLEFKTRMMVNSYLASVGTSGHASHLIPYKFHSESLIKKQIAEIEEKEKLKTKFKELRWKFLLVDDYALKPLREYNKPKQNDSTEECKEKGIPTKACIIKLILKEILDTEIEIIDWQNRKNATNNRDENNKNLIKCVGSITEAKNAMQTEMFDMIFLDYLLGKRDGGAREFGSELLREIQNKKDIQENAGPLGKFWIFPISAFSYAMMDELREQGYGYLSEYWYISGGADPINTPWLFKYKLVKFLNQQISSSKHNITNFLEGKFSSRSDVSLDARKCYSSLIILRKDYYSLKSDKKKSFLAKSMIKYLEKHNTPNHIWEHLHHLLYLLAFGSGLEWSEMWEEFTFIKNFICNQDTNCENANYLKPIKEHIIKLQNEYR